MNKKNIFLLMFVVSSVFFPLFSVRAQAVPVTIVSVEVTAVSTEAIFSITASGVSTTTSSNTFTFTPTSGGSSVVVTPTSNTVVDVSHGVRRLAVRIPASLSVGETSVVLTNTETGQSASATIDIISISLDTLSARKGDILDVRITRDGNPSNAPFIQGQTRVTFGSGITVNSVNVESPTSLVAHITISPTATLGLRSVTVTVPRGSAVKSGAFNVLPLIPTCSSAGPDGDTTVLNSGTRRVFAYGVSSDATEVWFPTNSDTPPYNPLIIDQPKDSSSNLDDLVWYPGINAGGGTWYADIDLASHPGLGDILVSAQLVNSASEMFICDSANFIRTIPSNVTLSSSTVTPDNLTQYNIVVSGTDEHGADKITAAQAVVNYEAGFGSNLRGFVSWYGPSDIYDGFQDRQCCSLNGANPPFCGAVNPVGGGFAAVQPFGSEYIHLDSCAVVDTGNTRSVSFTVRFTPSFTSPTSNNDLFGFVETSTCCKVGYTFQQNDGYETGYINADTNFSIDIPTPSVPTITGPFSGYVNQNINYTFNSTDSSGVRYGVDWKKADGTPYVSTDVMDGTADTWLPTSGLVPSGTTLNTDLVWTTVGNKIFQALAQNLYGVNSAWSSSYPVSIAATPTPGVCGPAATVYPQGSSSYAGAYCTDGTPSDTPSFPAPNSSVSWTCLGLNGGSDSPLCTATLVNTTRTVSINSIPVGGSVMSSPGGINCGGGGIACSDTYGDGEVVVLTAVPKSSYWKFSGWSGTSCSGTFPACVFTVDGPEDATATFELRAFNYKEF